MSSDQIAVLVSLASLAIALFALGWNVYRDVILKPRVKVSISKGIVTSEIMEPTDQIILSAVNFGPGKVKLSMIWFRHATLLGRLLKKYKHGVQLHDYRNPMSGQLPCTLDVGENLDLLFPWQDDALPGRQPSHIGLRDSFGRNHWAPKKQVAALNKEWRNAFGGDA